MPAPVKATARFAPRRVSAACQMRASGRGGDFSGDVSGFGRVLQEFPKIGGIGGLKGDEPPREGMPQPQRESVQPQAGERGPDLGRIALPVERVAHQRESRCVQVRPNLMPPPGAGTGLQQGAGFHAAQDAHLRAGGQAAGRVRGGALAASRVGAQGHLQDGFIPGGEAPYQGVIDFLRLPLLEL